MFVNFAKKIVSSCGRKKCLCCQKSIELALKIPLDKNDENNINFEFNKLHESYRGCKGSYKVMVNNLEWDYDTWDDMYKWK